MIGKFILLICLFISQVVVATDEKPVYRYSRSIKWQNTDQQTLLSVVLDTPVYAISQDDFSDLRLIDQDGIETPYLLQKIFIRKTEIKHRPIANKTRTLQKSGTDDIIITLTLDKDATKANGLTVLTEQRDFEYNLNIDGSEDGKTWHPLKHNALIYDYSRYMEANNHDIDLPANNDCYFKISIAKATQHRVSERLELTRTKDKNNEQIERHKDEPLHIADISLWHNQSETQSESPQQFDYPIVGFKIIENAEHKTSEIEINSERNPLTGFKLNINTPSFSRNAEVQITQQNGINNSTKFISSTRLQALNFKDVKREETSVFFSQQRQKNYRIVIKNQDNPPLSLTGVTGLGNRYQLVFLPLANKTYNLHYGSNKTTLPHYDTASIQELLQKGYPTVASQLGPETNNIPTDKEKLDSDLKDLINNVWFLRLVIGLMVLVLAWTLFKLSKRVADAPPM